MNDKIEVGDMVEILSLKMHTDSFVLPEMEGMIGGVYEVDSVQLFSAGIKNGEYVYRFHREAIRKITPSPAPRKDCGGDEPMNTNRVQYPKTMIVKYPHGKMQWVRDAGVVGAYQPMTTFDSCQVTHTESDSRNIRLAYRSESTSVVAIGDITGVTAVSPDFGDTPADFDEIMQGLAEWDMAQAEHQSMIGIC